MPNASHFADLDGDLRRATQLLKDSRRDEAAQLAASLVRRLPGAADAWLLCCAVAQQAGNFEDMLAHAERALELAPDNRTAQFRVIECQLYCGRADLAIESLARLEQEAGGDHRLLVKVAEFHTHCTNHADANRCYERAVELQPSNAEYLFSLAASLTVVGKLDEAETALSQAIRLNPRDYDAYRNRSTLRRQTEQDNHVDEMLALLDEGVSRPAGEAQLCYALAKEYEDLGDFKRAFSFLKRGAARRRSLMAYRVESDLAAIEKIIDVFAQPMFARATRGCTRRGPVFVLGLPRSGTTLVDRILASHSEVESLGEVNDFAYALMRTAGGGHGKLELIAQAAGIDFALLGERYSDSTRAYGKRAAYLVDKTPLNYLYIGLIHLALPNARIVHVQRDPMDSCYGMYRTLFRAGYPFTYDFDDLARYYIAYRQLMDHWREAIPDGFLDVYYESLVSNQETVSREIVEYCGLDWEAACLAFEKNEAPVATASAAQVRRPMYREAVGRWRRYEKELQPLATRLRACGIETGQGRT